jgi:hypothetical protein
MSSTIMLDAKSCIKTTPVYKNIENFYGRQLVCLTSTACCMRLQSFRVNEKRRELPTFIVAAAKRWQTHRQIYFVYILTEW